MNKFAAEILQMILDLLQMISLGVAFGLSVVGLTWLIMEML